MKIKKIKILKNKVRISFDDSKQIELNKESFTNFYLYEGKEVSSKEYKALEAATSEEKLLSYALKLREKNIYTEYKLREKLYDKGGDKKTIDSIIKFMKKHDLVDDEAFIADHIEYYNSLNYGKNKIIAKLLDKGIFKERIEKIKFPENIERKKANNILLSLERKYDKYNYQQKKNHIYQAYLSQGFDNSAASEMVDKIKPSKDRDELDKLKKDFDKAYIRLERKYSKKEIRYKIIPLLLNKGYKMNDIMKVVEKKL